MLDLRRLRLLVELHERGTIAAVAEALQYTPSAVSQQLAVLERETGVTLLARAGRGVRLTDPALVLVQHAEVLLDHAARAESDLAAASGEITGRARIAGFQSVSLRLIIPAIETLGRTAPRLRCEVLEAEHEQSIPALAVGDVDVVIGDEWGHQPLTIPSDVAREDLLDDEVLLLLPVRHPLARRHRDEVPIAELAGAVWAAGYAGMGWAAMVERTCRRLGGFDPDIRHRTSDGTISVALVSRGMAVTLLPRLIIPERLPGVAVRGIAEGGLSRTIFAATRATDTERPSTSAVLAAIRDAVAAL